MFARHKRRPAEDEPLVPHGLIWQATDELDEPGQEVPANPRPVEVLEIPLRQENGLADKNQVTAPGSSPEISSPAHPDPVPAKLGAISPPIPWPSPKTASVIRRVPPPSVAPPEPTLPVSQRPIAHSNASAPSTRSPLPVPIKTSTEQRAKLEIVKSVRASRNAMSKRLKAAAQVLNGRAHKSYASATQSLHHARRRAAATYETMKLRGQILRAQHAVAKYAQNGLASSRSARAALRSWWAARRLEIARARSAVASSSSTTTKASLARSAALSQRLRNYQFHVRIVKSPLVQAMIQRSRLAWVARRDAVRRQPRLWTSLAMAALSALLTLLVISGLSRYGPNAHASSKNPQAPASISPGSLIAPKTALASTRKRSEKSPAHELEANSLASKSSPSTVSDKPKPVARRVHHNDDEDYVAPDTYHYYGTAGKSR